MDEDFKNVFNEYYPFERYIVKTPKSINRLFDDLLLTELFIPYTKINPVTYNNNDIKGSLTWAGINKDNIYIKVKGVAGEARLAYSDFAEHIKETIREIIINDFGHDNYQSLYINCEDKAELKEALNKQKSLIELKYGECKVKKDTPSNNLL